MIRVDWGLNGLRALAPDSDVIVIVDVLSFTTSVEVALSRGAVVLPYRWRDETIEAYAGDHDAELALGRGQGTRWSLSPSSFVEAPSGLRVVLPSLNGSTLTMEAAQSGARVFAGCLRNARATARAAAAHGERIGVVAAGEKWPDTSLRPCLEDWVGAGAVIGHLAGPRSAEASAAQAAFDACRQDMAANLSASPSGQELADKGYAGNVALAAEIDVAVAAAAELHDGEYRRATV